MIAAISFSGVLSVIAILISLLTLFYVRRQEQREKNAKQWAEKFEQAVALVMKIRPVMIVPNQAWGYHTQANAYGVVFPDLDLRQRIESHLVRVIPGRSIPEPRYPNRDQLSTPAIQKTITDVLGSVEKFKNISPGDAKQIGLQ